jgi:hypothetical protein
MHTDELIPGWTEDRLLRCAAAGAKSCPARWLPHPDRVQIAYDGIVDHLLEHPDSIWREAVYRAASTVGRAAAADRQFHGIRSSDGRVSGRYLAWWDAVAAPTGNPEEPVVETRALAQILPQLTNRERGALLALAAHGGRLEAAHALGVPVDTFNARVRAGRRRFLTLWHEGESPSQVWRIDRPRRTDRWSTSGRTGTIRPRQRRPHAR